MSWNKFLNGRLFDEKREHKVHLGFIMVLCAWKRIKLDKSISFVSPDYKSLPSKPTCPWSHTHIHTRTIDCTQPPVQIPSSVLNLQVLSLLFPSHLLVITPYCKSRLHSVYAPIREFFVPRAKVIFIVYFPYSVFISTLNLNLLLDIKLRKSILYFIYVYIAYCKTSLPSQYLFWLIFCLILN